MVMHSVRMEARVAGAVLYLLRSPVHIVAADPQVFTRPVTVAQIVKGSIMISLGFVDVISEAGTSVCYFSLALEAG